MRALIVIGVLAACGDDGPGTNLDAAGPDGPLADANLNPDNPLIPAGCVAERGMTDRADDYGLDQIRILYVVPQDGMDRMRDTNGQICNSVRGFATWFHSQSPAYLRFDTMGGLVDIGFVRLTKTDAAMRGTDPNNTSVATGTAFVRNRIELELEAMGMIAENKLYGVYYEGSSVYACGGGAYPPLIIDRVGAMYLGGIPPGVMPNCSDVRPWGQASLVPNYVDYGMLHELVHSMGIVPASAPNEQSQGHVFDGTAAEPSRDLMYSPRTTQDPGWAIDAAGGLMLDINNDDYYMTAPALDLAKMSLLAPLPDAATRPIGW
ncbi:MAG TPA: hypothetical protein VIV11_29900 [Kofleriaceae bacterium]